MFACLHQGKTAVQLLEGVLNASLHLNPTQSKSYLCCRFVRWEEETKLSRVTEQQKIWHELNGAA